jgi:RNA-binding protein
MQFFYENYCSACRIAPPAAAYPEYLTGFGDFNSLQKTTFHLMTLSNQQKKQFRTIGHSLKPVVTIAAKGTTESVVMELERAISDHELIKIKVVVGDRDKRNSTISTVNEILGSITVQQIGNIALIYKAAKKPDPMLSNISRHFG